MRFLIDRKPGRESELFAEAAALMDDGLDADFVLGLYPDDAEWLAPLLQTGRAVRKAVDVEEPSFFFEASLKSKFLAGAREVREPLAAPRPGQSGHPPCRRRERGRIQLAPGRA